MSYFGLHLQTPVDDWDKELNRAANAGKPYRIVKAFWVEAGKTVKNISKSTTTVFRHHIEHQQPYLDAAIISPADADDAADDFILRFSDSVNQHGHLDYVESLNETYATEDILGQQKAVAFDRAFIRRLKVICPNTKPVVYTAPPGNIDHDEYAVLIDLARECEAAGGAFGYHNYWSVVNKHSYVNSPSHAHDYHMRWAGLDAYLIFKGIRVKHMLGESGAIGAGPEGYWQKPDDGWLKSDVWGGDVNGYLSDIVSMDALYADCLAGRENRLLGATLFTSGTTDYGWDEFQIQKPFLTKLTDYIIDSTTVPPPPEPPPPPPPEPPPLTSFQKKAWAVTVEMQETGQGGIQLNAEAAIQKEINNDNMNGDLDLQIVTTEEFVEGKTVQAAESRTGKVPRRVYVWHRLEGTYWFEEV
jgi:hypothetical protein